MTTATPSPISHPDRRRFDVPNAATLLELASSPLPLGLPSPVATRAFHRDLYFDTADDALRRRGASCRFRLSAEDRRVLSFSIASGDAWGSAVGPTDAGRWSDAVPELDGWRALAGNSEPARRLRGLIDPAHLEPRLQIETDRLRRRLTSR